MEIEITDVASRTIRIQVKPDIPVGILMGALIKDGLESPKGPCFLAKGRDKLLGPDGYWMTLQAAGIVEGDRLQLVGRAKPKVKTDATGPHSFQNRTKDLLGP